MPNRQKKLKKLRNKFCFPNGLSVIQADRFYVTYCIEVNAYLTDG